jgi:hypothetical protein
MRPLFLCLLVASCHSETAHADAAVAAAKPADGGVAAVAVDIGGTSTLSVTNSTKIATVVYFAFGADSAITSWPVCPTTSRLNCQMPLPAGATVPLPLGGKYLNATFSFGAPVSCGSTKGELNLNNPKWYDIADVSLVDGYSNKIEIDIGAVKLGPPKGKTGNSKVYGLFPLGCDICTARQHPPCGMTPGKGDCKAGTQYKPAVICQWQGSVKGGGSGVRAYFKGD